RWWAGIEDMDTSGAGQVMMDLVHHLTKCARIYPELRFARYCVELRLIEPKLDRCKRSWNHFGGGVLGYAVADADSNDHIALSPLDVGRQTRKTELGGGFHPLEQIPATSIAVLLEQHD